MKSFTASSIPFGIEFFRSGLLPSCCQCSQFTNCVSMSYISRFCVRLQKLISYHSGCARKVGDFMLAPALNYLNLCWVLLIAVIMASIITYRPPWIFMKDL